MSTTRLPHASRIVLATLVAAASALGVGCAAQGISFRDLFPGLPPGFFDPDTLIIRVINNSNDRAEVTMFVDGFDLSITCNAQSFCDEFFAPCPELIQPVSMRLTDDTGGFSGGQDFTELEEPLILDPSDYRCGSILIFRIGTDGTMEIRPF